MYCLIKKKRYIVCLINCRLVEEDPWLLPVYPVPTQSATRLQEFYPTLLIRNWPIGESNGYPLPLSAINDVQSDPGQLILHVPSSNSISIAYPQLHNKMKTWSVPTQTMPYDLELIFLCVLPSTKN